MAAPQKPPRDDDFVPYRSMTARRRVLVALLAVATALTVVALLLDPPGATRRQRAPRADVPACSASATANCVGGATAVIAPRPASAASR